MASLLGLLFIVGIASLSSRVFRAFSQPRNEPRYNLLRRGSRRKLIHCHTPAGSIFSPVPSVHFTRFCGGSLLSTPFSPRSGSPIWFTSRRGNHHANPISTAFSPSILISSFATAIWCQFLPWSSMIPHTIKKIGSPVIRLWTQFLRQSRSQLSTCVRSEVTCWTRFDRSFFRICPLHRYCRRLMTLDTCLLLWDTQTPNQAMQPTAGRRTAPLSFMKTRPLQATLPLASGG